MKLINVINREKINKERKIEGIIKDWISIAIGAFLIALATNLFFATNDIVTGGVSGIGIIIKKYFEIPLWMTSITLNIPLFLILFMLKGKKVGVKSIFGMLMLTLGLYFTEGFKINISDLLLSCIFGGILTGIGAGMVFAGLGSTGGSDVIAMIIQHIFPFLKVQDILGGVEVIIVLGGMFVFGIEKGLYALIAIYVFTKVIDIIIEGARFGKIAFIISNYYEEIGKDILNEIGRGATSLRGEGMFSHDNKNILICVIKSKQLPTLKQIISRYDKNAFVFISDAREVLGEGFNVRTINDN